MRVTGRVGQGGVCMDVQRKLGYTKKTVKDYKERRIQREREG